MIAVLIFSGVAVFIAAVVEQRKADPDIENDVTSPRR